MISVSNALFFTIGALSLSEATAFLSKLRIQSNAPDSVRYPSIETTPIFGAASKLPFNNSSLPLNVESAILSRFACKSFRRFDGISDADDTASVSNPDVVSLARHCLDIARWAPSGFNTQPYKLILVDSPEKKLALSRYALGPNAVRVRNSDCTAVFLADKKIMKTFPTLFQWFRTTNSPNRQVTWQSTLKMKFYITIFSSGLFLPRILASPVTFLIRTAMCIIGFFTRSFYPMPSLSSAETWASKNVSLVAMAFMLACSSHGLATIPMEGIDAGGIKRVLNIPSRYSIPLIVSVGTAERPREYSESDQLARRYPAEGMIFENAFGGGMTQSS